MLALMVSGKPGVDATTMRAVAERLLARGERGQPKPPALPKDKRRFPKMLCLDFNQWVYLGQADPSAQKKSDRCKDALAAVREAVATGKLVVPIFGANAYEVANPRDPARRERIATFMVNLSGNTCVPHVTPLQWKEVASAVSAHLLGGKRAKSWRPTLVRRGVIHATVGKVPSLPSDGRPMGWLAREAIFEPEHSIEALAHAVDTSVVDALRAQELALVQRLEQMRAPNAQMTEHERRKREVFNLLCGGGALSQRVATLLQSHGRRPEVLSAWLADESHREAFMRDAPTIETFVSVLLTRDKNADQKFDPNDTEDFSLLRVGIPYANIVVTEKRWASIAVAAKLDRRYSTAVAGDATELPKLLKDAGCL